MSLAQAAFRCSAIRKPLARCSRWSACESRMWDEWSRADGPAQRPPARSAAPPPAFVGGIALYLSPMSNARPQSSLALAAIGALAGGVGAAGIGAGLAAAEVLARSRRGLALAVCGAASGALVALIAHLCSGRCWTACLACAFLTKAARSTGSCWAPRPASGTRWPRLSLQAAGWRRLPGSDGWPPASIVGACCAAAATALALSGRLLVGGLVHDIARLSRDAELVLAPLGHFIGEPGFGPITRALLSGFEGAAFGCALTWGLTRRPTPAATA